MFVGVEYENKPVSATDRHLFGDRTRRNGQRGDNHLRREDLSISGAPESVVISADHPNVVQTHFFNLVSDSNPDVIVLDFSRAPPSGTDTILTIRQRSAVPILVACDPGHPMTEDYRIAGAADCIAVPIDIFALNQTILRILRATERVMPLESKPDEEPSVDGTDSRGQQGALASAVSSW